jgi:alpha-glucoside transport system permease protein
MTSAAPRVEYPHEGGTEPQPRRGAWRSYLVPLAFIGPAAVFLLVYLIYPALYTMWRSLYSDRGGDFVGIDNYELMFRDDVIFTAIKNNFLWVLIVPALVTAVGLVFAVLTEKIRWAVAFKIVVFMPLAVSLFAVGVIWRIMYQDDPDRGVVNAAIVGVQGIVSEAGAFSRAQPSTDALSGDSDSRIVLEDPVRPGDVALLGLTAVPNDELPDETEEARRPEPLSGGIAGVVWRDFGGETPGEVEGREIGLGGVKVELRRDGDVVESATTEDDGTFAFE